MNYEEEGYSVLPTFHFPETCFEIKIVEEMANFVGPCIDKCCAILAKVDNTVWLFTIAAAFIWREQSGNQVGSNKRKIWKKKKEAFSRKIVLGFYLPPPLPSSIVYIEFVLVNKHYRRIV